MIDPEREELIRIPGEGRKLVPDSPSAPTWWRWINRGIIVDGKRRKLEVLKIGAKVYTTRSAFYERFAVHQGANQITSARTSAARERAIQNAEAELNAPAVSKTKRNKIAPKTCQGGAIETKKREN